MPAMLGIFAVFAMSVAASRDDIVLLQSRPIHPGQKITKDNATISTRSSPRDLAVLQRRGSRESKKNNATISTSSPGNVAVLQGRRGQESKKNNATITTWTSPRDLAVLRDPDKLTFHDGFSFWIFSAVPSFGQDGNFIALLLTDNSSWHVAYQRPMFCSGPRRSHLTRVKIHRRNLLCEWPAQEADRETFEVFLEDEKGQNIGKVIAKRKPGMVQGKYRTVACVRDVYVRGDRSESDFGDSVGRLLQWLEFQWQHGIDHFFVYTFRGTEDAVKDVLMPYLKAGIATRIHSEVDPAGEPNSVGFHFDQVIRDCLYRAKSHATWAIPSFDNDEYFRLASGRMFPNNSVPQNYMGTIWDAIRKARGKRLDQVRSISFRKIVTAAPKSNEALLISSPWRESTLQHMMARPTIDALPKYAYNVHLAYDLWWHWVYHPNPRTEDIEIDPSVGFVQHYRIPWGSKSATVHDEALVHDAPLLRQAIEKRFGESLEPLLRRLHQARPNRV